MHDVCVWVSVCVVCGVCVGVWVCGVWVRVGSYMFATQLFADLVALDTLEVSGNQFSGDISKLKFKSGTLQIVRMYMCVSVNKHAPAMLPPSYPMLSPSYTHTHTHTHTHTPPPPHTHTHTYRRTHTTTHTHTHTHTRRLSACVGGKLALSCVQSPSSYCVQSPSSYCVQSPFSYCVQSPFSYCVQSPSSYCAQSPSNVPHRPLMCHIAL